MAIGAGMRVPASHASGIRSVEPYGILVCEEFDGKEKKQEINSWISGDGPARLRHPMRRCGLVALNRANLRLADALLRPPPVKRHQERSADQTQTHSQIKLNSRTNFSPVEFGIKGVSSEPHSAHSALLPSICYTRMVCPLISSYIGRIGGHTPAGLISFLNWLGLTCR